MSQSTKTNNQLLLEKCIEEEYKESTGYKTKNDYFEHFAASQVLKNLTLVMKKLIMVILGVHLMEVVIIYIFF